MPIEIRPFPGDRPYREFSEAIAIGFSEEASDADVADWERLSERDRILAAWDGDRVVGGAGAFTMKLTVPGGEVDAAGVTAVSVMPSHRRRGILRELMRRQLDDVRERGEPVAILWASEGSIYQRFGYGLATLVGNVEVERGRTAYRAAAPPEGQVRFLNRDEATRAFPPIYEQLRVAWPGFFNRTDAWWEIEILADPQRRRHGAGPKFYALYEADGRAEGYVIYRVRQDWDARGPSSVLEVRELMPLTLRATRDLWRFVFDVDLIRIIRAERVQPHPPLLLLAAEPRRLGLTLGDGLWLRLVDLAAALSARSYAREDSLVFRVSDEFCPWNAGWWRLDAGGGGDRVNTVESVRSAGKAPALAVDVTDLAAAYLGAFSFAQLASAGRVQELSPGALERADAVFATAREPWCPAVF